MSDRTGLGPLEIALLRTLDAFAGSRTVGTTTILDALEDGEQYAPAYGARALQDLGVPWRVHLRLVDLEGNWGSAHGDPMADPAYTQVGLSALGRLALAAERDEAGPVPIGLVNGSVFHGGKVPPLDPSRVVEVLRRLMRGEPIDTETLDGLVHLPTEGIVAGDLKALRDGRLARVLMSCRISRETARGAPQLVITGSPAGIDLDELEQMLSSRVTAPHNPLPYRPVHYLSDEDPGPVPQEPSPLLDVRDESTMRAGTRIVLRVARGTDLDSAEDWVRHVWPVTVEADWRIPGGLEASLRSWAERCRSDPSGLDALSDLIT